MLNERLPQCFRLLALPIPLGFGAVRRKQRAINQITKTTEPSEQLADVLCTRLYLKILAASEFQKHVSLGQTTVICSPTCCPIIHAGFLPV